MFDPPHRYSVILADPLNLRNFVARLLLVSWNLTRIEYSYLNDRAIVTFDVNSDIDMVRSELLQTELDDVHIIIDTLEQIC